MDSLQEPISRVAATSAAPQRCTALMAKTQGRSQLQELLRLPQASPTAPALPTQQSLPGDPANKLGQQPLLLKSVSKPRIINNATIGQHIFTFFRREVMDDNCTLGTTLP